MAFTLSVDMEILVMHKMYGKDGVAANGQI